MRISDTFLQSVNRLERALEAPTLRHEKAWAEEVSRALGGVEEALGSRAAESGSTDGPFGEVDLTRPSLARQVGTLRREIDDFQAEARALRAELDQAAQACQAPLDQAGQAEEIVPPPAPRASVVDFGALRDRLRGFAAALRQHREGESALVQESVTTDIGTGD